MKLFLKGNKAMLAAANFADNPSAAAASAAAAAVACTARLSGGFGSTVANLGPPGVVQLMQPTQLQQNLISASSVS